VSREAIERLIESINRFSKYQEMSNKELAKELTEKIWGKMNARDPNSDLLSEAIDRLENPENYFKGMT
jgi:hypothetical protein